MTWLMAFAYVILPLAVLAMGYGAMRLNEASGRAGQRRIHPGE